MFGLRSSVCRLIRLGVVGAGLAGCGFHPLYAGRHASGLDTELASIKVAPAPERIGQLIVLSLRGGLNPSGIQAEQRYVLAITVVRGVGDFGVRKDGTASRELYAATASFQLVDVGRNAPVLGGAARANDSYDVGESPFTTIVANEDADRKAAESISQQIQSQIAVFLRRKVSAPPAPPL